jgi:hypothetical protein
MIIAPPLITQLGHDEGSDEPCVNEDGGVPVEITVVVV